MAGRPPKRETDPDKPERAGQKEALRGRRPKRSWRRQSKNEAAITVNRKSSWARGEHHAATPPGSDRFSGDPFRDVGYIDSIGLYINMMCILERFALAFGTTPARLGATRRCKSGQRLKLSTATGRRARTAAAPLVTSFESRALAPSWSWSCA